MNDNEVIARNIVEGMVLAAGKRLDRIKLPTQWRPLPDGRWYRVVNIDCTGAKIEIATTETVTVLLELEP